MVTLDPACHPRCMAGATAIWISVGGSVLATLVGVVTGGLIGHSSQQSQRNREARINAYTDLLRRYADVQTRVSQPWRKGRFVVDGWSDWNRALAVVALVGSPAVV